MYRLVLLIALCAAGAVQAADLTVDPAVFRALDSAQAAQKIEPAMRGACLLVHRESVGNAPRSPSMARFRSASASTRLPIF